MTTTAILIASLSLFMLILALKLRHAWNTIDDLEIRVFKLEKKHGCLSQQGAPR